MEIEKNNKKKRSVLWEVHENERERERAGSVKCGKMNEGMHEWRNKRWVETKKVDYRRWDVKERWEKEKPKGAATKEGSQD